MKEHPILFSAPMVRAILEGRKSMTRRIVKCDQNIISLSSNHEFRKRSPYPLAPDDKGFYFETDSTIIGLRCPYGGPGDRLWVRESWALTHPFFDYETQCVDEFIPFEGKIPKEMPDSYWKVVYGANFNEMQVHKDDRFIKNWKPSIHMPRWASRLTLEVVSVRVERLQEIHWHDALKEGIKPEMCGCGGDPECGCLGMPIEDPTYEFQNLWESINGPGSWEANPWVWAIEFKRIKEVPRGREN